MSISLGKAIDNITKDSGWLSNFAILVGIMLVPALLQAFLFRYNFQLFNPNIKSTAQVADLFAQMGCTSLIGFFSIITGLMFYGYCSTYLRNLLFNKNAALPDWKSNMKDIFKSGLLYYGFVFLSIICFYLLLLPLAIIVTPFFLASKILGVLIAVVCICFLVLLLIAYLLYYNALWLNFSAKNFDFCAWWDFIGAKKYINADYFASIGIMILLGIAISIAIVILFIAISIPLAIASTITNSLTSVVMLLAGIIYMVPVTFMMLIFTNLLSQNFYNVIEKK